MFDDKTVLITGGTGSFGTQFVRRIAKDFKPRKVIIYSRRVKAIQYAARLPLKKTFLLRFFIGDVEIFPDLRWP